MHNGEPRQGRVRPRIRVRAYRPPSTTTPAVRMAKRFAAAFDGGPHHGRAVDNCLSPEDAIGALIRSVIESLDSREQILEFVASLFADLSVRSVNVAIARAVWCAAEHPRRRHAGIRIDTSAATSPSARWQRAPTQ